MVSHEKVAEEWLKGNKSTGSRMFTNGITVFSYGEHFPIAHKLSERIVLFNVSKYSSSTSHHQSYVRRVLHNYKTTGDVIECRTGEIKNAINYPNEPIIIKEKVPIEDIDSALEVIRRYCKTKGVKRFPMKEFKEKISKIVFVASL